MKTIGACLNIRSRRDGAAMLATVVGLVLILSIYTAGVFAYVGTQRRAVDNQVDIEQAFTVAEAGAERAVAYIEQHHGIVGSTTYANGSVNYGTSVQSNQYATVIDPLPKPGYFYKIISTGTVYRTTWTGSSMPVSRVVTLNQVSLPSWSQYSLWSHENGMIYFVSGDVFSGKVHADDKMYFQGSPWFKGLVTSAANAYGGTINSVRFDQGFKLNTSGGSMADVPFDDLLDLASNVSGGIVLPTDTTIQFSNTNYRIKCAGTAYTNAWLQIPTNALIYVKGNVYVAGTNGGRVTIVADGTIHITNNLTYTSGTNTTSNEALGLISKNDVWVDTSCPKSMSIFAHIMATGYTNDNPNNRGSFGAVNYSTRPSGTLTLYGGIVQDLRGAVGLADNSHGYLKKYTYDARFATNPPPYYPVQSDSINYTGWEEHAVRVP